MIRTPGRQWGLRTYERVVRSDGSIVADNVDSEDASLIAAAPCLLAACEDFIEWLEPDMGDDRERFLYLTVKAAIKKAEGRE